MDNYDSLQRSIKDEWDELEITKEKFHKGHAKRMQILNDHIDALRKSNSDATSEKNDTHTTGNEESFDEINKMLDDLLRD